MKTIISNQWGTIHAALNPLLSEGEGGEPLASRVRYLSALQGTSRVRYLSDARFPSSVASTVGTSQPRNSFRGILPSGSPELGRARSFLTLSTQWGGWRALASRVGLIALLFLTLTLPVAHADDIYSTPAPAATVVTPTPAIPAVDSTTYVLSPDDQIDIAVLGHDELRASVTVLPDGSFDYPILGNVHAAGQTISGLTRTLTQGLSVRYNQPEVTVFLRQGRARKVSVLGDGSKTTGQFEYKSGMHLLDLLAAAGGPAGEPQLISATLVTDNGRQTSPIQLVPLLTGADASQNLPLAPGDILFLVAKNPEVGQVQVVGEVGKPGAYSIMPSGISILALLNDAGNALPTARLTSAQIMHNGTVQTVNLRPLLTTDLNDPAGKIRILPGDVLLVPANKNIVLALGEVRSPGVLSIPDDQPLTLTRAYADVGGATVDGDKKCVSIVRRSPDGTAKLMSVNMEDMLKGKDGIHDLTLQPQDILFIQTRNHPKSVGDIISSIGSLGFGLQAARIVGL